MLLSDICLVEKSMRPCRDWNKIDINRFIKRYMSTDTLSMTAPQIYIAPKTGALLWYFVFSRLNFHAFRLYTLDDTALISYAKLVACDKFCI